MVSERKKRLIDEVNGDSCEAQNCAAVLPLRLAPNAECRRQP